MFPLSTHHHQPLPRSNCETEGFSVNTPLLRSKRETDGVFLLSTNPNHPSLARNARRRGCFFCRHATTNPSLARIARWRGSFCPSNETPHHHFMPPPPTSPLMEDPSKYPEHDKHTPLGVFFVFGASPTPPLPSDTTNTLSWGVCCLHLLPNPSTCLT